MAQITKKYYDVSATSNTPQVKKAVGQQILRKIASVLYAPDSTNLYYPWDTVPANGMQRFVIADMEETSTSQRAAAAFNSANLRYPFTAYNFGEVEFAREFRSYKQVSGFMYSSEMSKKISSIPARLNIPMITFFSNPDDYEIGYKLLLHDASKLSRTFTTTNFNGYSGIIPITFSYELAKGSYAFEFQEQLRAGNIFDVVHNVTAYYQEILLDGTSIYPVDQIIAYYKQWSDVDVSLATTQETLYPSAAPVISSSDPYNGETGVPVENSVIINFSQVMNESTVENAITLSPYFEHKVIWDIDSKILMLDPIYDLTSGTVYSISFDETAYSFYNNDQLDSGVIRFTTEV